MSIVFDASALITFLRDEPGAEAVERSIEDPAESKYIHSFNLCEVYYDFHRASGENAAETAINDLIGLGVQERNDLDPAFCWILRSGGQWVGSKRCTGDYP